MSLLNLFRRSSGTTVQQNAPKPSLTPQDWATSFQQERKAEKDAASGVAAWTRLRDHFPKVFGALQTLADIRPDLTATATTKYMAGIRETCTEYALTLPGCEKTQEERAALGLEGRFVAPVRVIYSADRGKIIHASLGSAEDEDGLVRNIMKGAEGEGLIAVVETPGLGGLSRAQIVRGPAVGLEAKKQATITEPAPTP
jgi:hypothetical protein